jgi:hypothetical protein
MTGQPSIIDVMADLMVTIPKPVDRKVHVSEHVRAFLRHAHARDTRPGAATVMLGLPIVVDDDLTGGQWQIRENGEVTSSGDMAPAREGMTVSYSPMTGWIAIRTDLTESMLATTWENR